MLFRLLSLSAGAYSTLSVVMPNGNAITGQSFDGYDSFLGIPYAESTAGANRWKPPVAKASWGNQTYDASKFGPCCPSDECYSEECHASEDCLSLNIFTPPGASDASSDSLLPVLVWVHGGGFEHGNGSRTPLWNGQFMVSRSKAVGGVIFVSFNYRLGALGWMADTDTLTGNYGFMDQQLALQWVQDNVQAFGGDKDRVTLMGQSAGAMSAYSHLVSPASKGLFQRVHIRSNIGLHYRSPSEAEGHASTLATLLDCKTGIFGITGKIDADCLRGKSVSSIIEMESTPEYLTHLTENNYGINFLPWLPTIDGTILPDHPLPMIKAGTLNPVDAVLIGTTRNESLAFLPDLLKVADIAIGSELESIITDLEFNTMLGKNAAPAVTAEYSKENFGSSGQIQKAARIMTDYLWTCHAREVARALLNQSAAPAVFAYSFMRIPSAHADPDNSNVCSPSEWDAACHASDNMFLFGTESIIDGASFQGIEKNISDAVLMTSVNFTAMPTQEAVLGVHPFVPFDASSDRSVAFGGDDGNDVYSIIEGYHGQAYSHCDFWSQNVGWSS